MKRPLLRQKAAFTVAEVLMAAGIAALVTTAALGSMAALQRGFSFCTTITDVETNQVRLFDSMALDFRNAKTATFTTSGTSNVLPVTLNIPNLYSAYETSGDLAGDPGRLATRSGPSVSSTGKVTYTDQITVTYDLATSGSGQVVNRTVTWTDSSGSYTATRPVASLNSGSSISFQNTSGGLVGSSDVAVVISMTGSAPRNTISSTTALTTTLTRTVFLRAKSLK